MDSFAKLLPLAWPYRRAVLLSVFLAVGISILWAGNLSGSLPIVKVLFQNQSLHEYVDLEISTTQTAIDQREKDIAAFGPNDVEPREKAIRVQSEAAGYLLQMTMIRDQVLPYVPQDRFQALALLLGLLVFATFLKGVLIYFQEIVVGDVVNRTVVDLRKRCFRHALRLDYQTLSATGPSQLLSRIVNDVEILAVGLRTLLVKLIREPLKAGGCIALAFVVNWRLTLMSLFVVPLLGFAFGRMGKSLKRASHGTLETMSGLCKCLTETFDAIKVVLAFGAGRKRRRLFHETSRQYYRKSQKVVRVSSIAKPLVELMGVISVLAAVMPGAYLVLAPTDNIAGLQLSNGPMSVGELTLLYALLVGTLDSIRKLSSVYGEMKRAAAAADRVFAILNEKTRVPEPAMPRVLPRLASEIRFENIHFSYHQESVDGKMRPPALRGIDLTIQAGEVVAVIGENGSGKSTLINLLPRFMDPDQGGIFIDGVDIRDVRSSDLRRQIGLVTQETLLFDESIRENIRYGRAEATNQEIEEAAERAHVLSFINQLPAGFDTAVGEKGQRLSGGQRQRLALARAIVRDPAILILDEATSAIDSQSEQMIHRVLKQFVGGRTVFIITHVINDTFLDLVTRIVVLDKGVVAASGSHQELLRTCPIYQRLYHASASCRAA